MRNEIKDFPKEIVDKMLEYQKKCSGVENIEVFKTHKRASQLRDGFNWWETPEGEYFWEDVIGENKFDVFFKLYPKEPEEHYLHEEFVSYYIAEELKNLGFNSKCLGCISTCNTIILDMKGITNKDCKGLICALPLWQQAMDFIRKEYKLSIILKPSDEFKSDNFSFEITSNDINMIIGESPNHPYSLYRMNYKNYEEARESAIILAIELINDKMKLKINKLV